MDERIVNALAEPPPPDTASAAVQEQWTQLLEARLQYRECVATSRSAEGLNLSMSPEFAGNLLVVEHRAYRRLLEVSSVAAGTNPALLAKQRGHTVDWSQGQLHRL